MAVNIPSLMTLSREQLATKYATVTANPKPNYNIDGQQISWADYCEALLRQIESTGGQVSGGCWEVES